MGKKRARIFREYFPMHHDIQRTSLAPPSKVDRSLAVRRYLQVKPGIEKPYAHLALQIQQEPSSYETITEIDPFDLAEMFGNVGGFWGERGSAVAACGTRH